METFKKLQRFELLIFTVIVIASLLPYIATRFFPSMDGASHLANANIINQLAIHRNPLFGQFFRLNPEPVPNWTAHLLLSTLMLVMPAFLAEKILVIILLAGIPYAFRSLVRVIAPNNVLYSYLIFPFTHSMFLFFGFYNFCLGILFFMLTLKYWLKYRHRAPDVRFTIMMILFVAATYFSHIVLFGILMIVIAVNIFATAINRLIIMKYGTGPALRSLLRESITVFLAGIGPMALFVFFFYSRPGTREISYIGRHELLGFLKTARPLISFNAEIEGKYTTVIALILLFLLAAGGALWLFRTGHRLIERDKPKKRHIPDDSSREAPVWWIGGSILILTALYFLLPDAYGTASYTSLRIAFFIFVLLILFAAVIRLPWYFSVLAGATGLFVNVMLIRINTPGMHDLGKLATECNEAAAHLEPNSLVLPIYCLDNWFTGHFVDYLAVDKPVVMVYNYECESGYFPVIWNLQKKPDYYFGDPAKPERFINFQVLKNRPSERLDYVFIVGNYNPEKDWFFSTLHGVLTDYFTCVYKAENCSLYRNNFPGRTIQ